MTSIRLQGIKACVFDAYGTLFDVNSATRAARTRSAHAGSPSRTCGGRSSCNTRGCEDWAVTTRTSLWQVTSDALSLPWKVFGSTIADLHPRLMSLYLSLDVFPEVKPTLERLKAGGLKLAILSNGTPAMLASAVEHSGIGPLLDAVLSVEEVGVFKPHPSVYRLASDRLKHAPQAICFVSSNSSDAHAAKAFGFQVIWCNRSEQGPERISATPDAEMSTMSGLPGAVLP